MVKSIVQSIFARAFVAAVNLLILVATSRYLGVSSRGEISLFVLNIAIIQGLSDVYTGYGILRFIPRTNLHKVILNGLLFAFSVVSISNLLLNRLHTQIEGYEWMGYLISLLVVLNTFNCVLIMGKQKIGWYNAMSMLQPALLILFIAIAVFGFRIYTFEAYVFPLFASFAMATLISSWLVYKLSRTGSGVISQISMKEILLNGLLYQSSAILLMLCNRISYYLITNKAGLGLYSSATVLTESVLIISSALAPLLMTTVANQTSETGSIRISVSLARLSFILVSLAMVVVLLIPESFYLWFIGLGFKGIKSIMLAYFPAVICAGFIAVLSAYFTAKSLQKVVLFTYLLGFISALLLSPFLIRYFGLHGAAYSADLAYFLVCVSMLFAFRKQAKQGLFHLFFTGGNSLALKQIVNKVNAGSSATQVE